MGANNNIQYLRTGIKNAYRSPPGCATVVGRTQKVLSIPRHSALLDFRRVPHEGFSVSEGENDALP